MIFRRFSLSALFLVCLAALMLRGDRSLAAGGASSSVDLQTGPMMMFAESCAKCHGDSGSLYNDQFYTLTDPWLFQLTQGMMIHEAKLQPTSEEVWAMFAYQRALRDRKPFVVITNAESVARGKALVIEGEASLGAKVSVVTPVEEHVTERDFVFWRSGYVPRGPFSVVVRHAGEVRAFPFPERQWTGPVGTVKQAGQPPANQGR